MKYFFNQIVLVVGVTLSLILAWATQGQIQEKNQLLFETASKEITLKVKSRMDAYRQTLYAGKSYFDASNEVTKEEWRLFVKALRINENFPGIQGLGFSKVIPKTQAKNPSDSQEIYTSIVYLEPLDERNIRAVGYDMFSQETRREAMNRALDSGEVAASGKVKLLQENGTDEQAGFLVYVPVYKKGALLHNRAERKAALLGFVYAAFRVDDLMQGIMGDRYKDIQLEIFDNSLLNENLLFKNPQALEQLTDFKAQTEINVDGREWILVKQAYEGFFNDTELGLNLPALVLVIGLILSFLFYSMMRFIITRQQMAQAIADEMTLQFSEQTQKLNNILLGTNVGTWEWNINTGKTIFNDLWVNMVGYSLEELMPTTVDTWTTLLHPDDLDKVNNALEQHFSGESDFYEVEMRMKHKDGHWVWILAKGKVSEWDADGKPVLMYGTQQNITATKEIEQTLRSERDLFSDGPVITIEWQLIDHWPVRYVSKNVIDILGYTADEMLADDFVYENIIHQDDLEPIVNEVHRHISQGSQSWEQSYRLRLKNGEYRWFYDFSQIVLNEDGQAVSIRGYMFDQTHIKELEAQVLLEKNFISAIVENANAVIAVIDSNGTMIRLNAYGQRFTQYSLEEISSEPYFWKRLFPLEVQDKVTQIVENARQGILAPSFQNAWTAKDGTQKMFEWSNTLVNKPDGSMDYITTIGLDITETKKMEENLVKAKEEAIAANISKSQFLANMSHEIRTPMNAIIGLSQLMQDSDLSPKDQDTLQKIHGSSKMLLGIINDILDYSKIEANKLLLDKQPLNLEDVLSQLRVLFTQTAMDKKIELNFYLSHDVPGLVLADELRLDQILTNILSNALKFTSEGLVTLEITLVEKSEQQCRIGFSVTDTGIGLSSEESEKLFKPFTQADTSITRKYGGTGLGLAITQKLIQAMGGELKLKSQKGEGSTFFFEIDAEVESWPRAYPEIKENDYKILLVDDQPISRKILLEMAKHFGCITHEASNGLEAIELIKQADQQGAPYNAVVLDYVMPVMNGRETIVHIKEMEKHGILTSTVPSILMVSGHSIHEVHPGELGVEVFLTKPVTRSSFFDALASVSNSIYPQEQNAIEKPKHQQLSNINLLLVEDNELNQEVVTRMLKRVGINHVTVACNGKEAVDFYSAEPEAFNLILMDLQMPIMSGYEATIQIRKTNTQIPIIALTAAALVEDKERVLKAGMNDHLSKPIDMEQLFRTIAKWTQAEVQELPKPIEQKAQNNALQAIDLNHLHAIIGDDEALLKDFLTRFLKQLDEDFVNIVEQIKTVPAESKSTIHALKGLSGNMGASKLFAVSKELNETLNVGSEIEPEKIAELEMALIELKSELKIQIEAMSVNQNKPERFNDETSDETFKEMYEKLFKQIETGDFIELNSLEVIIHELQTRVNEQELQAWKEAVDAFDYDRAKELMEKWTI